MTPKDSRFMVMGLNGPVLRDLVGTMKDGFPGLEASTANTEAEAVEQIEQTKCWKYAFLDIAPAAFAASQLSNLFDALGTKVVLLGNAAEDAAQCSPYPVLVRPFTANDIINLLR